MPPPDSIGSLKESPFPYKDFLRAAISLPPLLKMATLFFLLMFAIVMAALTQHSREAWTLTYIVAVGMMVAFMGFIVMYMVRPPGVDKNLHQGHVTRSDRIRRKQAGPRAKEPEA